MMTHFYEVKRKTRDPMMGTESAIEVNISDFSLYYSYYLVFIKMR